MSPKSNNSRAVGLFFSFFMLLSLFSVAGVAAGQPAANQSVNESVEVPDRPGVVVSNDSERLDEVTVLESWTYEDQTFSLRFNAEKPGQLTITEMVQELEGTGQFAITRERIPSGRSTVTIQVPRKAGQAGVAITSARSIREGRGIYVSTGQTASPSPFSRTSPTAGWLGGVSVMATMLIGAAWQALRKEYDEPEEFE